MKVLLRADAGVETGTGHVMRCLALAEELVARGDEVILHGTLGEVAWLRTRVESLGIRVVDAPRDGFDLDALRGVDAAVIDSYLIPADLIAEVDARTPVLAIVDGDDRGIRASAYLDQNLGAQRDAYSDRVSEKLLAGSSYALVRRAFASRRVEGRWRIDGEPHLVAVMGGTDPVGAIVPIAASMSRMGPPGRATVVCAPRWRARVLDAVEGWDAVDVIEPLQDLPALLDTASIVVSAAGTSAWDVCTMGVPAVLVAVVDNQRDGLARAQAAGLAVGVDASADLAELDAVGVAVDRLLRDEAARRSMSERCLATFDGRGCQRVADALVVLAEAQRRGS